MTLNVNVKDDDDDDDGVTGCTSSPDVGPDGEYTLVGRFVPGVHCTGEPTRVTGCSGLSNS